MILYVKVNAYICEQSVLYFKNMHMIVHHSHLKLLNRWELFQFMSDALTFADKFQDEMPVAFTTKVEEWRSAFNIYDEELTLERRPSSKQLQAADEQRDYAIRKIYQLIRAHSDYRFDPELEHAAKALLFIFRRYGTATKISRMNHDAQTGAITNLLQELARVEAQQHIATLHLTKAVEVLKTENTVFSKEMHIRDKLMTNYVTGVVKDARLDVQSHFIELTDLINALATVEGPEKYARLKRTLSALLKEYVTKARARNKKPVKPTPK